MSSYRRVGMSKSWSVSEGLAASYNYREHGGMGDTDIVRSSPEVIISSFSFKTGPPCAANLVIDVRFLPDPRWLEQDYPSVTGLDSAVAVFIQKDATFEPFFKELKANAKRVVDDLGSKGCQKVLLAVGCTAGRHRSVFVAQALGTWLKDNHQDGADLVKVYHRDMSGGAVCPTDIRPCSEIADQSSSRSSTVNGNDDDGMDFKMDFDDDELSPVPSDTPTRISSPTTGLPTGPLSGPAMQCTYCPETNQLEFRPRSSSLPCQGVLGSLLGNGLSNLKDLRQRRAKPGDRNSSFDMDEGGFPKFRKISSSVPQDLVMLRQQSMTV